jgi:hypothetical protein
VWAINMQMIMEAVVWWSSEGLKIVGEGGWW